MVKKRILIVEDDPDTCLLLSQLFEKIGYDLTITNNGRDAIVSIKTKVADLVIFDVMLPDMDGWETFEQIRESTDSPAICLSAVPSHQFASQSLKMGEVDYIHKPFYNADLLARVDALVNRTPVLPVYPVVSWGDYSARRPKVSVIIPTLNEAATFLSSSHIPLPVRVSTVILSLKSNRESLHDLQDIIGQRPLSCLYWRSPTANSAPGTGAQPARAHGQGCHRLARRFRSGRGAAGHPGPPPETASYLGLLDAGRPQAALPGALRQVKGVQQLPDAYQRLISPPPLVLIGTREQDSPTLFPPGVTVLHNFPHPAVMEAWQRSLFGVIPSLWPEPLGSVVYKGMSKGKAMISTTPGGHTDMIVPGQTGLLVPAGDVDVLTAAMQRLIDNPQISRQYGQAGYERAKAYNAGIAVPQFEELYKRIVVSHQSG